MNYLSVENISKSYGERVLFKDLSFGINKDQKVAFVAKNGTGKTSILNIIAGIDVPDTGQVIQRKGIYIAYLSQEENFDPLLTIEETIFATENKILPIIKQYEAWFTENIEIQNGPYIFYGLPGLILEIYDTKKEYSFKLLGIAKEEKKFPEQKGNVVKTTKKDFDKAVTNVYKTIENRILGDSKIEFKRRIADLKKNKIINPLEIEE